MYTETCLPVSLFTCVLFDQLFRVVNPHNLLRRHLCGECALTLTLSQVSIRFATRPPRERGKRGLFHYTAIIQELDRFFVLAMLPHQREKPDAAFADPKVCGGEGHV